MMSNQSISNAAYIKDVYNNSLRIGYDIYSLNSDNLTNENITSSLTDLNQVYFKIGGRWYDVVAAQSDAEIGNPLNALGSAAVDGWTGLKTWYKAGSEYTSLEDTITLPASPSGLTATPVSASQINLSWNSVTGASSYNVYRSTSQVGPYSKINNCTANSYIDSGLTANTSYWYRISAVNNAGEGNFSISVGAPTQATLEIYLNNAKTFYSNSQYNEAIAECSKALLISTNNADIYLIRGLSYLWLDQLPNAWSDFHTTLQLDPNKAKAYSGQRVLLYKK
jgi:tetratricopeptide (TPR) repeat protein